MSVWVIARYMKRGERKLKALVTKCIQNCRDASTMEFLARDTTKPLLKF